ncbi:putative MFS monocarboxylate transporter [Talaromyces proteolyticus]|uniref:4a-hydroxytetrahydrobiopterin dehydratase n=1 Tax=Talaromyces proteolyticus TaxID=1131652 RepID=A0AAD4KI05_9EURO|nr:putative MFS monocarboxylate transporter [Talaromyces proteolyticus]KAH8688855.1 putative MFS monocarboxylate transporter [Talaromyces proteolyticus]
MSTSPLFAPGVDPAQNTAPLQSLLEQSLWSLDADRMGVTKTYYFKTYTKCLDFVQVVGIRSKSKNHHSTMTVKSGSVHVHWTTHVPRGLSEKDIQMAQYCDQQAGQIGTVSQAEANKCVLIQYWMTQNDPLILSSLQLIIFFHTMEADLEKAQGREEHGQKQSNSGDIQEIQTPASMDFENTLSKHPTSGSQAKATLAKTMSLVRTRESGRDPGPPLDGGFVAWSQVALAHLVICNTWGYINAFGVFQTYYTETLHRTPSDISWIGSVETFLVFFVGTFSGRATDAGYFKFTWTVGAILAVVSIFLTSLCTQYWQIFLSQGILQGIGCGLMFCPTLSLLPTYFDSHRAIAMSIVAAGSGVGGLIFPGIVNSLLPKIGYAWTMRTLGFFTFATLLPSAFFLRQRLPPRQSGPILELAAFRELPYVCFSVGMFLVLWGLYVGFFYVSSYARDVLGASLSTSTNLLMIMSAVGTVARIVPGLISDHYTGPLNLLIPFSFATAITAYGWSGVRNIPGVFAFSVIYGIASAGVQGIFPVALSSLTTDLKKIGVRMGMVLTIVSFAALTGSPIAGALVQADQGGYLYMQMFMGSSMLLGTVLLVVARIARFGVVMVRG